MAGTLTVTWNNSTPVGGPFRVAYRYPAWNGNAPSIGFPAYVVVPGVICLTGSCSENISIPVVTDDACDTLTINGYIQPECEDIVSLDGRIFFSETFTPASPCNAVRFLCGDPVACTSFGLGTGCHGTLGTQQSKTAGEEFSICYDGGITGPDFTTAVQAAATGAGYSVAADLVTCCYECIELTITFDDTVVGSGGRVQYEVCDGTPPLMASLSYTPGVPSPPVTVCARPNSWSSDLPGAFTYTTGAPCT
jgi:hypothetical protein